MSAQYKTVKNTIPARTKKMRAEFATKGGLAVGRGLEVIRSEVVPLTPVVTSRLKNSIQGQPKLQDDMIWSVVRNGLVIIGTVGTNVPYAARIEFGFVGADKLGRNYNQAGKFYFTRGFNLAKPKVDRVIANTLRM